MYVLSSIALVHQFVLPSDEQLIKNSLFQRKPWLHLETSKLYEIGVPNCLFGIFIVYLLCRAYDIFLPRFLPF